MEKDRLSGKLAVILDADVAGSTALVQLVEHDFSEVTGPAFSPDGKRLYFSSQRGRTGSSRAGITFEVEGPFHLWA